MDKQKQAVDSQRKYYADTAANYDRVHGAEIQEWLAYAYCLMSHHELSSVLDVGAGTGGAASYFLDRGMVVTGVEPSSALVDMAIAKGLPQGLILQGDGEALPFPDRSFDSVCEFAVLHHVKNPEPIVKEMIRVARHMVILCDSNRFGQGSWTQRLFKLFLYKVGLWRAFNWVRTRGRGYMYSEGDGIYYSYSVYDSLDLLASWADSIILFPTGDCTTATSWLHPLLTASGILAVAIKE